MVVGAVVVVVGTVVVVVGAVVVVVGTVVVVVGTVVVVVGTVVVVVGTVVVVVVVVGRCVTSGQRQHRVGPERCPCTSRKSSLPSTGGNCAPLVVK